MRELTRLIKEDMKPALGVTEPGAIAYAVASAKSHVNGEVKKVHVHELLLDYMAELVQATRKDKEILSGVSPRGTMALLRASQAYAWIQGRDYVVPEDIKKVAGPVMAHRLVLSRGFGGAVTGKIKIEEILSKVSVPTEEWER